MASVSVHVSSPAAEMPAGAPERLGVGKKETLRFCTMNDLLTQAHPNALVPGADAGARFAPISMRRTRGTQPRRAVWVSLIHEPLLVPPLSRQTADIVWDDDGQKANWGSRRGGKAEKRDGGPSRGTQAFRAHTFGQTVPREYLASCGRWPDLVLQHGWAAEDQAACEAAILLEVQQLSEYYWRGRLDVRRALYTGEIRSQSSLYTSSTASYRVPASWWGGRGRRGCKDFSRRTAFDKTGRRMGAREEICWFSQSREVLDGRPLWERVSSRLVQSDSGAPIFCSGV